MNKFSDVDSAKRGVSVLATCIVETMNETDPHFRDRFLENLSKAYRKLRDDSDNDELSSLELLGWTRSLITGFDFADGQGKPFLED